jgi:hypothetical protein
MESNNTTKNPAANTATPKTEKFDFKKTLKETFETVKNVFVKPASADISRFDNAKNAAIFTGFAAVIYIVTYHLSSLISTIVKKAAIIHTNHIASPAIQKQLLILVDLTAKFTSQP